MIPSLFNSTVPPSACSAALIPYPDLFGAEFLSLQANFIANHSQNVPPGYYSNHGSVNVQNANFCNVTVTYTHPGQNDTINVQVWLPSDTWNGRLQHIGGSGWQAGLHQAGLMAMMASVGEGYATVGTDGGLGSDVTPVNWGLLSEGNVNLYLLQDLASTTLNDASVIAKSVIGSFYKTPPKYSYYTGCSQGGRQGFQLAQRYPDAYDGIAASAPAINWNQFVMQGMWGMFVMDQLGEYPPACEINAITSAALKACDGADGIEDGVVSDTDSCDFDPATVVGSTVNCTELGSERKVSAAAAEIVRRVWDGARRADNTTIWFGPSKEAVLTGSITDVAIVPTTCAANGTCTRGSFEIADDWLKLFLLKNSSASTANMTQAEFDYLAHLSVQVYESMMGTNSPDLSRFRARGGKLVGYHGTTDTLIPVRGSTHYYDSVLAQDAHADDFFRLFLAPGVNHCFGGNGAYPAGTFDAMREWVENGVAPDTLMASTVGVTPAFKRPLCPYPKKQVYDGVGNSTLGEGFSCV
ncbi:putative feruloyl esterase [Colletotrichum siamense]|nr:putative feruloyl esterase [Colletotrichum siamense]